MVLIKRFRLVLLCMCFMYILLGCAGKGVSDVSTVSDSKRLKQFLDMDFSSYKFKVSYIQNGYTGDLVVTVSDKLVHMSGEASYISGVMFYQGNIELYVDDSGKVYKKEGDTEFEELYDYDNRITSGDWSYSSFKNLAEDGNTVVCENDSGGAFKFYFEDGKSVPYRIKVIFEDTELEVSDIIVGGQVVEIPDDIYNSDVSDTPNKADPLYFFLLGELNPLSSEQLSMYLSDYIESEKMYEANTIVLTWLNTYTYEDFISKLSGYSSMSSSEKKAVKMMYKSGIITKKVLKEAGVSVKALKKGDKNGSNY